MHLAGASVVGGAPTLIGRKKRGGAVHLALSRMDSDIKGNDFNDRFCRKPAQRVWQATPGRVGRNLPSASPPKLGQLFIDLPYWISSVRERSWQWGECLLESVYCPRFAWKASALSNPFQINVPLGHQSMHALRRRFQNLWSLGGSSDRSTRSGR